MNKGVLSLILGNATITRLVLIGMLGLAITTRVYWKDLQIWWAQWETSRCEETLRDKLDDLAICEADLAQANEPNPKVAEALPGLFKDAAKATPAGTAQELNQWLENRFTW